MLGPSVEVEIESAHLKAIAQKRGLVAAVISSYGASEFVNQDLEEMAGGVR